jgi:hypothetical protein
VAAATSHLPPPFDGSGSVEPGTSDQAVAHLIPPPFDDDSGMDPGPSVVARVTFFSFFLFLKMAHFVS